MSEDALEKTYEMRDAFWKSVGEVGSDVLAPMINPSFNGGPMWPDLRQAFVTVTLENGYTLLASDGLSDPFNPEYFEADADSAEQNGFEVEVFCAVRTGALGDKWPLKLVNEIAQQAANHTGFRPLLDKMGVISMELNGDGFPDKVRAENGNIGLLFGMPFRNLIEPVPLALSTFLPMSIQFLTPAELEVVRTDGPNGRSRIRDALIAQGMAGICDIDRRSVV